MSNKETWDKLQNQGNLDSNLKDGPLKTTAQKALGLGYPIIVVILTAITATIMIVRKRDMKWYVFFPHMIIGSICGWNWGIYMEHADPNYPGWLFHPWAIMGPEWLLTIEDWLFYPVCGAFFYALFRILPIKGTSKNWSKWTFQFFHLTITLFFIYFTSKAGQSIAFQFALVSIPLFFYTWNKWNTIHYLKLLTFIVIFATLWDWAAVSWLTYIPGMAWASQWVYVSFDASGAAHHSTVFLSYKDYPWAWIFQNPIEITPWFGIGGGMFTYSLTMAIEKFIDSHRTQTASVTPITTKNENICCPKCGSIAIKSEIGDYYNCISKTCPWSGKV